MSQLKGIKLFSRWLVFSVVTTIYFERMKIFTVNISKKLCFVLNNIQSFIILSCESTEDLIDNFLQFHSRSFFRTKRRLSIAPLPVLRLNDKEMMSADFENHSMISNQNSISSMNSLASLLKEKMQVCFLLFHQFFLLYLRSESHNNFAFC